jgi:Protein of unknown function (DUF4231)
MLRRWREPREETLRTVGMHVPETEELWVDPTWTRLEDQIDWYDLKAGLAQRAYKRLKVIQVVLAALIPASRTTSWPCWTPGSLCCRRW